MNWIAHPIILENDRVKLVPLDPSHFPALLEIGRQEMIWQYMNIQGWDEAGRLQYLKSAILKRGTQEQYPFAVIDKTTNKIIGSTMFHNIFSEHKKLEIGWTWYDPAYWGTGYNTLCKLLLLTYCFETLGAVRVQLVAGEQNIRSRKAIEKIGAKMEGIMRKERKRPDGSFRNTVMYSIIDDEWPEVKTMLQQMLA